MIETEIQIYMVVAEISSVTREMAYFTKHLPRCKKEVDKAYLTARIVILIASFGTLITYFNNLKDELFEKLTGFKA